MSDMNLINEEISIAMAQAGEAEQVILEALQIANGETTALLQESLNIEATAKAFEASVVTYTDTFDQAWQRAMAAFEQSVVDWQEDAAALEAQNDGDDETQSTLESAQYLIDQIDEFKNQMAGDEDDFSLGKRKKSRTKSKKKS